jgi:hypothetical protein
MGPGDVSVAGDLALSPIQCYAEERDSHILGEDGAQQQPSL